MTSIDPDRISTLVLNVPIGKSVFIGDDVRLQVIEAGGGQAKLAFYAPRSVVILREELLEKLEAKR